MVVFEINTPTGWAKASRVGKEQFTLEYSLTGKQHSLVKVASLERLEREYWKVLKKYFF